MPSFSRPFLLLPILAALLVLPASQASALPALFDFGDGPVQTGWVGVTTTGLAATSEGIQLSILPLGNPLGARDRGAQNGGGDENDMWRDFFFIGTEDESIPPADRGFDITLSGLVADATYDVTLWAFDFPSVNAGVFGPPRNGDWNGEILNFGSTSNTAPESLDEYTLTIRVVADATGTALVQGRSANGPTIASPFLNGLRVDVAAVPEPTTALLMGLGLLALATRRRSA
ncbi:MAG: PEP-CTERM sorting domain-containing protein [Myxococcota bacterium]